MNGIVSGYIGRVEGVRIIENHGPPAPKRAKPGKPASYYATNHPREVARRQRQIAAGTLQVAQ